MEVGSDSIDFFAREGQCGRPMWELRLTETVVLVVLFSHNLIGTTMSVLKNYPSNCITKKHTLVIHRGVHVRGGGVSFCGLFVRDVGKRSASWTAVGS